MGSPARINFLPLMMGIQQAWRIVSPNGDFMRIVFRTYRFKSLGSFVNYDDIKFYIIQDTSS